MKARMAPYSLLSESTVTETETAPRCNITLAQCACVCCTLQALSCICEHRMTEESARVRDCSSAHTVKLSHCECY